MTEYVDPPADRAPKPAAAEQSSTAGPASSHDASSDESPAPAAEQATRPTVRVARRRCDLTADEREFLRRHDGDRPPYHDSRWG